MKSERQVRPLVERLREAAHAMDVNMDAMLMDEAAHAIEQCVATIATDTARRRSPLTDAQIEQGREYTFSTANPFCPCDSKTMRKAVRWAERAHGITA